MTIFGKGRLISTEKNVHSEDKMLVTLLLKIFMSRSRFTSHRISIISVQIYIATTKCQSRSQNFSGLDCIQFYSNGLHFQGKKLKI